MKVEVQVEVLRSKRSFIYDLSDLGVSSESEWDELSESERSRIVIANVDAEPNQPYWSIESFDKK